MYIDVDRPTRMFFTDGQHRPWGRQRQASAVSVPRPHPALRTAHSRPTYASPHQTLFAPLSSTLLSSTPLSASSQNAVPTNRRGQMRIFSNKRSPLSDGPAIPDPDAIPHSQRMRWGAPTWRLFHAMAEQIDPAQFTRVRLELFDLVTGICDNLPCPDCAAHASAYMRRVDFRRIQTRDQFRDMLFEFHNSVNARKGVPRFNPEQLAQYRGVNLLEALHVFLHFFTNRHHGHGTLVPHGFARDVQAGRVRDWFRSNAGIFRHE